MKSMFVMMMMMRKLRQYVSTVRMNSHELLVVMPMRCGKAAQLHGSLAGCHGASLFLKLACMQFLA